MMCKRYKSHLPSPAGRSRSTGGWCWGTAIPAAALCPSSSCKSSSWPASPPPACRTASGTWRWPPWTCRCRRPPWHRGSCCTLLWSPKAWRRRLEKSWPTSSAVEGIYYYWIKTRGEKKTKEDFSHTAKRLKVQHQQNYRENLNQNLAVLKLWKKKKKSAISLHLYREEPQQQEHQATWKDGAVLVQN